MPVIRPNPCAVTFVYVVGLISPEAVTCDTSASCGMTFAVCTVTTPLLAWLTLNSTIPPSTTAAPTPMPTFCHVFIAFLFAYESDNPNGYTKPCVPSLLLYIRSYTAECFALETKPFAFCSLPCLLSSGFGPPAPTGPHTTPRPSTPPHSPHLPF